jgi:hypothetical protein
MTRKYKSKQINCPNCGYKMLKSQKKCPNCGKMRYERIYKQPKLERNEQLVRMVDTGNFTLEEIGGKFGITRERVRQRYKISTGKPCRVRIEKKIEIRNKLKNEHLEEISFYCNNCNTPVKFKDKKHKSKYCEKCGILNKKYSICFDNKFICNNCGKEYNPTRVAISQRKLHPEKYKHNFCNKECYFEFIRKNANNKK